MNAPAAAAAAATWPAAAPLTAVASASLASAPSTSVQAAQLTTASGRAVETADATARGSQTSSSRRDSGVTSCPARVAAAVTSWPSIPAAPVTSRRIGVSGSSAASSRAQGERQLEARVGVLEPIAEEVAQLAHAVADGLRVHAERHRDRLDLAGPVEPRGQRLRQSRAGTVGQCGERSEPRRGEVRRDTRVRREQQDAIWARSVAVALRRLAGRREARCYAWSRTARESGIWQARFRIRSAPLPGRASSRMTSPRTASLGAG